MPIFYERIKIQDVIHHIQAAVRCSSEESNLILSSESALFPLCNLHVLWVWISKTSSPNIWTFFKTA